MTRKNLIIGFSVLFIVLIIANIWVFLSRDWESSFVPTTYATLYYPLDVPTIKKWEIVDRKKIKLHISGLKDIKDWTITCEGKNPRSATGLSPIIELKEAEQKPHVYSLISQTGAKIQFSVRFYSKEFYAAHGNERGDVYIVKPDVPCGNFKQFRVADWVDDYSYVGEKGLKEVDQLLKEEAGIAPENSTFEKMERVTRFLRKKLINARGVPKDDARWMNPFLLYKDMSAGTGKGWCTQHAQIYVFFANRAGIPTRFVFGARTEGNSIVYTGHSWAESYIKEQNRWAFVDFTHAIIYVTDKKGLALNSAELFHLNQHDSFDSTFARLYRDWEWQKLKVEETVDSLVTVPFQLCNRVVKSEFIPQAIIKFRRPPNVEDVRNNYSDLFKDRTFFLGNLERYFFKPPLAYSLYPTEGARTYLIRRSLLFGLLLMGGLLIWVIFRK